MALIFLSYRRTDSPQACRVYDQLVQRFGHQNVFMDVAAIPFAVSFPDFIQEAIANSKVLIALIGAQWGARIHEAGDPVRMEIETALVRHIPVLPVLIGSAAMPTADELPRSIASIAAQNAVVVGVLHDFHTHIQVLIPKIEAILSSLASTAYDPNIILVACQGVIRSLEQAYPTARYYARWLVMSSHDFSMPGGSLVTVSLFLHRVARLGALLELHFILSFWAEAADAEQALAGWVLNHLEQNPVIPDEVFQWMFRGNPFDLKIRRSDEDPRQIWKMITDQPLRLSLAYIGTVSEKPAQVDASGSIAAGAGG